MSSTVTRPACARKLPGRAPPRRLLADTGKCDRKPSLDPGASYAKDLSVRANTPFYFKPFNHFSSHLDVPRTASSQCVLDDADVAATVKDAISCITTAPEEAIQITVENGWVTLRGKLDSWAERDTVECIALHSVGVRGVINSMTVEGKGTEGA